MREDRNMTDREKRLTEIRGRIGRGFYPTQSRADIEFLLAELSRDDGGDELKPERQRQPFGPAIAAGWERAEE